MKKVLHVSHSLDTGGGPLAVKKAIEDISGIEHFAAGNSGHYLTLFQSHLGSDRVLKLHGKNIIKSVLSLLRFVRQHGIDIVHAHGRGAGIYARVLKLFLPNLNVYYTLHGFMPELDHPLVRIFYISIERIFLVFTDQFILVSQSELERFRKHIDARPEKISLIPNYLKLSDNPQSQLPIPLDRNYVNLAFVGRFVHQKGIDILIDALASHPLPSVRLYMIGYGDLHDFVQRGIKSKKLGDTVVVIGKLNNASSHLTQFDGIVIPSRYEGMPFVCLEAMLAKVPVIVTPAVGITDLISSSSGYVAEDFTPESLRRTIDEFLDDYHNKKETITAKTATAFHLLKNNFSDNNILKLKYLYQNGARKSEH